MAVPKLGSAMRFLMAGGAGAVLLSPAGVALADKADPKKKEQGPLFDPEALERGAKALREINSSPHAKQVGPMLWGSGAGPTARPSLHERPPVCRCARSASRPGTTCPLTFPPTVLPLWGGSPETTLAHPRPP
jgi:hypothetical protein